MIVSPSEDQPGSEKPEDGLIRRSDLESALRKEREDRDRIIAAQEHRLLPAIGAVASTLFNYQGNDRGARLVASLTALFWCLIPSTGTATVGAVAIASLIVAWQQTKLLSAQNERIEVQNMLAEAQRRAGLSIEMTTVLDAVEQQRKQSEGTITKCRSHTQFECWSQGANGRLAFVPSSSLVGRLAALSQNLRPYRYLNVEAWRDTHFDTQCGLEAPRYRPLFWSAPGDNAPSPSMQKVIERLPVKLTESYWQRIWNWLTRMTIATRNWLATSLSPESDRFSDVSLSCVPVSPERGQLLASLRAANVDINRISSEGANFYFSELSANLSGINLDLFDLSYSKLGKAIFDKSSLSGVNFQNTQLGAVGFREATLDGVSFRNAIGGFEMIRALGYFVFEKAILGPNTTLEGLRIEDRVPSDINLLTQFCRDPDKRGSERRTLFSNLAMIAQIRKPPAGTRAYLSAIVTKADGSEDGIYWQGENAGDAITISYFEFDRCTPAVSAIRR